MFSLDVLSFNAACLWVIVHENPLNLKKTTFSVLLCSVINLWKIPYPTCCYISVRTHRHFIRGHGYHSLNFILFSLSVLRSHWYHSLNFIIFSLSVVTGIIPLIL